MHNWTDKVIDRVCGSDKTSWALLMKLVRDEVSVAYEKRIKELEAQIKDKNEMLIERQRTIAKLYAQISELRDVAHS